MNVIPVTTVRIIGKDYSLVEAPTSFEGVPAGQANSLTQQIIYSPNQSEQSLRDTCIHECVHCISYEMNLDLTERQVHALGSGLYAWMTENPRLMEWLLAQ